MAFHVCEHHDPLTTLIRQTYRCNAMQTPDARVQPLRVVAQRGGRAQLHGSLAPMLERDTPITIPKTRATVAAELAGTRSAAIDIRLGLRLTSHFLSALGLPIPGGALSADLWTGAATLAFEIHQVRQVELDIAELGKSLKGTRIGSSPATALFLEDRDVTMYVVTRVLTSRHFAVRTMSSKGQSAEVSVDALSEVFGRVSTRVQWHKDTDGKVRFRGTSPVTFAFAAVPCTIQTGGKFYFGLDDAQIRLGHDSAPVAPRPLVEADGLFAFNEP